MSWLSSLFGGSSRTNDPPPDPPLQLHLPTSVQGTPISLGWGQDRVAGNLLWYGGFDTLAVQQNTSSGGKGGGGNSGGGPVSYLYFASFMFCICEGQIVGAPASYWTGQSGKTATAGLPIDFTGTGTPTQTAWPYLNTNFPTHNFNYRELSVVALANFNMGSSPDIPQFSWEVQYAISGAISGIPDADPAQVVIDICANTRYSPLLNGGLVAAMTNYSNYCVANGLVVSMTLASQTSAQAFIQNILRATNSEAIWSGGVLDVVPYGDSSITANGRTYTAPSAPIYAFNDDDFIADQGRPPILVMRAEIAQQKNVIRVEYLDRADDYNPTIAEAKDDAAIQAFGLIPGDVISTHEFRLASAALYSAQMLLGRMKVLRRFQFKVLGKYILLDPMDIVSLTDAALGLSAQWVRILSIVEQSDGTLMMEAEEYLNGTGAAPIYNLQTNTGFNPNYNVLPGNINTPIIFEPTVNLGAGREVWFGLSGVDTVNWGGCDIYVSRDGVNYQYMTRQVGPSRMGVITAAINSGSTTIAVDLTQSASTLRSGTAADAAAFYTLCYVGGVNEFFVYQTASLTSPFHYNLTLLTRGLFGTTAAAHSLNAPFLRLDAGVSKIPYDQSQIGKTILLKFLSFNVYGQMQQTLASATQYSYTIGGLLGGTTTVAAFAATGVLLLGDNGYQVPAIQVTWTALPNSAATDVIVEYYVNAQGIGTTKQVFFEPTAGIGYITDGIQAATQYQVRATIVTDPPLPTTFTSFTSVTTPSNPIAPTADPTPTVPTGLSLSNTAIIQQDGTVLAGVSASVASNASPTFSYFDFQFQDQTISQPFYSVPAFGLTASITNVRVGHTVGVRVRSVSKLGSLSGFTTTSTIVVSGQATAPTAPTGLTATAAVRTVFLSWTSPTTPDLAYIEIWQATVNNIASATLVSTETPTAWSTGNVGAAAISGLAPITQYFYWIRAVNTSGQAGNYNAGPTSGVSVTTAAVTTSDITANTIDADRLLAGSIVAGKMHANSITALNAAIDTAAINNANIIDLTVQNFKIANNAVSNFLIASANNSVVNAGATFIGTYGTLNVTAPNGYVVSIVFMNQYSSTYVQQAGEALQGDLVLNGSFIGTATLWQTPGPQPAAGYQTNGAYQFTASGGADSLTLKINTTNASASAGGFFSTIQAWTMKR